MQDLSQMSTEELLRMRNGSRPTAQPAPTRGPVFGPAPAPAAPPAPPKPTEVFTTLTPEQAAAEGLPAGGVYQRNSAGKVVTVQAAPAAPKTAPPASPEAAKERLARINTALKNLRDLDGVVSGSSMGTGSIVGQESFRAGDDFGGVSGWFNQTANDVSGKIEMVQGDLINQVRAEMEQSGTPIGVKGADTEKEASRLAASIANLAQTQDEPEFLTGVTRAREYYIRRLAATVDQLRQSGEPVDPNDFLQSALEQGATKDELLLLADGLGLEANEDQIAANIRSRDSGGGVNKFVPRDPAPSGGGGSALLTGLAQGAGDLVQDSADVVGMVTDPFARVLADALGYDGTQLPSLGQQVREGVGLPESAPGVGREVRRFATGALVGGGAARGLGALSSPGVTQNVLQTLGRTPIRDTMAGAGAGAGAAIGEQIGGTPGQVAGLVLGGLSGNSAANRLANIASGSTPNALAQAAGRQGVDLLPADAGGPVARAVTTGTRASPLSVTPVTNAAERQQGQFGGAVRRTAASQGEVVDTQAAGESIQRGAREFSRQTAERGSRLYDRAAAQARGVRAIRPSKTVAAVDGALTRMRANPAASPSDVASLEAFRENIANGVSIQGLRDARTTLSQGVYDGKLRSGTDQAMWKGILGNVADDIDAGLRSVGRSEAADTFRAADRFWAERVETIDQTLAPIIGKDGMKGGEEVLQAIESMARGQRGGNLRLSRLMASLPEGEAGNIRATLIDRLGRAKPGAQDAQGETFSAATFLTNWNKMTPQARASMFPDKAARENLNDLALISENTKRGQAMANTSNTGVAITSVNVIGGGAAAAANLPATLVGAGSLYLTGKLMASPRFARLLARTSKMPPEAANRTFREQLGVLSTRETSLKGDIEALMGAVNDNGRLAAQEDQPQQ